MSRQSIRIVTVIAMLAFITWAASLPVSRAGVLPVAVVAAQPSLPGTLTTEVIEVDGVMRDALVYIPAGLQAGVPAPLILSMHGASGNATVQSEWFGLNAEAERLGFIAVHPNGSELPVNTGTNQRSWNSGRIDFAMVLPDDVRFFSLLLDTLIAKYPVDQERVFAMGFSNGAAMTYRLACEMASRFAAIGIVAGKTQIPVCEPSHPLSVIHIHGTSDPTVPYGAFEDARGPVPAVPELIEFWRAHNACASDRETVMFRPVVEQQTYTSCRAGTEVRLYTIQEGFHCWPGYDFEPSRPQCPRNGPHMSFAATPLIAEFLLAHPRVAQ